MKRKLKQKTRRNQGQSLEEIRERLNPVNIGWRGQGVNLVVETTGQFLDPTLPAEHTGGSIRGSRKPSKLARRCPSGFPTLGNSRNISPVRISL